ncbi:nucleotide exchange factor GrpE [Patescibacteria group bacterium]
MDKNKELVYTDEEDSNSEGIKIKTNKLKEKIKQCQKEKEEYLSQAQRAMADLVNYRRRQEQLLEEFRKYSQIGFVRELLPVMDSLTAGGKEVELIKKQFESVLKQYNIIEIKAVGQEFNPQFHEAIEIEESKKKSGTIIEEIQKGYTMYDKVLRVSKVKIAK